MHPRDLAAASDLHAAAPPRHPPRGRLSRLSIAETVRTVFDGVERHGSVSLRAVEEFEEVANAQRWARANADAMVAAR